MQRKKIPKGAIQGGFPLPTQVVEAQTHGKETVFCWAPGKGPRTTLPTGSHGCKDPSADAQNRQEEGTQAEGLVDSGAFTHFNTWPHTISQDLEINE